MPPSLRDGIALSRGATAGCHIPPALLSPTGKHSQTSCSGAPSHPAPSWMFPHPLLQLPGCRSAWAFPLGELQDLPLTGLPDPWYVARCPPGGHTHHTSPKTTRRPFAMSWGRTAWSHCKEGAGGLPQPCPGTQAFGLKALEHEESTKKNKKLRH